MLDRKAKLDGIEVVGKDDRIELRVAATQTTVIIELTRDQAVKLAHYLITAEREL